MLIFAAHLLLAAGLGCEQSANTSGARIASGIKTGVVTPLREKDNVNRDILRGFVIEFVLLGQDDQPLPENNVEFEVEVQNRFDPTTACIGHPYGGETSGGTTYYVGPGTPCYDAWFHNHKGNTGPGEGWINGQQLAPGQSIFLRTEKNGSIKLPVFWKLAGDGFVDYHSSVKIQLLLRAVRTTHPEPDLVYNFDLDFAYNGTLSQIVIERAPEPWPAFLPDPQPHRLSVDCPVILSTVDTDGDGFPDDVDECPGILQGKAGPCGCGVSVEDLDNDWVLNCPSLSPQPAGTDRWPANSHCGLQDHCGQTPDLDHDGDVDMDDFGIFQRCFGHRTKVAQPDPCDLADTNWDDVVDGNDAAAMRPCQAGVGVPVKVPDCLPAAP
jgi:hypothetical protein